MDPKQEKTDLGRLSELLTEDNIGHKLVKNPCAHRNVERIVGYYPTGENVVNVSYKDDGIVSVIRGAATFGLFEVFGDAVSQPQRFEVEEDVIVFLNSLSGLRVEKNDEE